LTRPTRYGVQPPPSGGALDRPIGGLGKLLPGEHTVKVISAVLLKSTAWSVVIQDCRKECHFEVVVDWPKDWVVGTSLVATIELDRGYVLYTGPQGFQARDAQTRSVLTGWLPTAGEVYLTMVPLYPASTRLVRVTDGNREFEPLLYTAADAASQAARP
jgi:hypothetical protein